MRKFLQTIRVIQEVDNTKRNPKLGRGFSKARRLNPYNPLSYATVVIVLAVGVLMFGVVGIGKEIDHKNPFKWD